MEKDSNYILDFLEKKFPDRLPLVQTSDFELGVLIGQQKLINMLKIELKVNTQEEEIK